MARVDGSGGTIPRGEPAPAEGMTREVHQLGNKLNALSLRLFLLREGELAARDRGHVQEAHRLAEVSARLLTRIRRVLERPGRNGPRRLTARRNPR